MIISAVRLYNWENFRGSHAVKLKKGIYGIVAAYEDDPERSNAAGKTSFLEAIRFALYGDHRHRLEDEWITRGEDNGSVELDLEPGGVSVERTRVRGKSTQLEVTNGDGAKLKGDEAQLFINEHLGLSPKDFYASSYLRQKMHSLFVTGDPAERRAMISEWIGLDKLIAAEKYAKEKADAAESRCLSFQGIQRNALSAARSLVPADAKDVFAHLQVQGQELESQITALERAKALLEADRDTWKIAYAKWTSARALSTQYQALVEKGKALKMKLESFDLPAKEVELQNRKKAIEPLLAETRRLMAEERSLEDFSVSGFNGKCPVTKQACPVPDHIKGCRDSILSQLSPVKEALGNVRAATAELDTHDLERAIRNHESDRTTLHALRDQVRQFKPEELLDPGSIPHTETLTTTEAELKQAYQTKGRIQELLKLEDGYKSAVAAEALAKKTVAQWRSVRAIFGKNGAQRRVAESVMFGIQDHANHLLLDAGVPLTVDISWTREGSGFAPECEACGQHYPSKGGRTCDKCGTPRAPNLIQRLEVNLSDRSGALEDLSGIAIQLSAAEWLREVRGSDWGVLMLDEPFGSLDKTNRQALANHIVHLLSTWDQAFVISHSPDVTYALAQRILIIHTESGSKVSVI